MLNKQAFLFKYEGLLHGFPHPCAVLSCIWITFNLCCAQRDLLLRTDYLAFLLLLQYALGLHQRQPEKEQPSRNFISKPKEHFNFSEINQTSTKNNNTSGTCRWGLIYPPAPRIAWTESQGVKDLCFVLWYCSETETPSSHLFCIFF